MKGSLFFWGLVTLLYALPGVFTYAVEGSIPATQPASTDVLPPHVETESLAPLTLKPQPSATLPASTTAPVSATAIASTTTPLMLVKGITVTLSDTTGFARDTALDAATKQGLPTALERLPMDKKTAATTAKSVGNAQTFLKSYTIVKETILPTYRLTVDLTYNESLLRKNFGGKITKIVSVSGTTVSATQPTAGAVSPTALAPAVPLAPPPPPTHRFTVSITAENPSAVEDVVSTLESHPGDQVLYTLLTADETRLELQTPRSQEAVQSQLGPRATVTLPEGITPGPAAIPSATLVSALPPVTTRVTPSTPPATPTP